MSATAPPKEWPTTTGRSSFSAPIAFASVSALCGSGRIAGPRAVKGDDAKVLAKAIDQRMGEVPHLAAEAVDHDHRRSDALIEDMEAFAIKVKKAALRRHGFLDPPRGDDGKLDEPADHEQSGQKNHRQSHHGCPKIHLRMAMLDTGASRSTGGASLSRSGGRSVARASSDIRFVLLAAVASPRRPMLVIVLKACVTEMKETPCASKSSTSWQATASAGRPYRRRSRRSCGPGFNTGHGHIGWTMSHGSAKITADLIAGRTPAISMD